MPSNEAHPIFTCRMCGDCCRGYGGTVISEKDAARIADFLRIDLAGFHAKFCGFSGSKRILIQQSDGNCIFFDQMCTIHPVKPRMCRLWPFLPAVLTDVRNWRVMAAVCPGMRTDVSDAEIVARVKEVLQTR